jgi:hypothetical protein
MKKITIPAMALLVFALCVAGTTAYAFPGGFVSTTTSVSVDGSVNETVSVRYTTANNGLTEKNEWGYSYVTETPGRQSFGTQLSLEASNGSLWWNFQRVGLPDEPAPAPVIPYPFVVKPSFAHFF